MNSDVIIIGAGPIGLETAIALDGVGRHAVILDSGMVGATIATFPPGTRFFSSPERIAIAGVPIPSSLQEKTSREEYLAYLRCVSTQFALDVRTYHHVTDAIRQNGEWVVTTASPSGAVRTFHAPTVVLATGGTGRIRTLGVPGEDLGHVSHDPGDPHRFHGRRLVIIGGKNTAVETAIRAFRCGSDVTLIHRGSDIHKRVKHWLSPEFKALVSCSDISTSFGATAKEITAEGVVITTSTGNMETIAADDVLLAIGYECDTSVFQLFGVELKGDASAPVYDPLTMQTDVDGVFIAGTVIAGTQASYQVFIENAHIHSARIAAYLNGDSPPPDPPVRPIPEA
jgi:thioredoxin reductase (NADPH)